MKLYYSGASPYARKVLATAHETGQAKKIELAATTVLPTKPNADLGKENPLMKVPTLVTDGGEILYDSRVICEYLDAQHDGRKLFPPTGGERWRALRLQSLADGIIDAGILCRYEIATRPEDKRSAEWTAGQMLKVTQGLDQVEREPDILSGAVNIGHIALGCAVGWLEFRNVAEVRKGRPNLTKWYDGFLQRPSMQATLPKG
jgi:glutathione S-transferase